MTPGDIQDHLKQRPFLPLRIHMSDGSTYLVESPEDAFLWRFQIALGVDPDDSGLPTRAVYLSPDQVTRIEPLPTKSPSDSGAARGA